MKRNFLPGARWSQKGRPRSKKLPQAPVEEEPVPQAYTPALDKLRAQVARITLADEYTHQYVRKCHVCGEQKRDVFRTKQEKTGKVIVRKIRGCGCPPSETVEITKDMALLARNCALELGFRAENEDNELFEMAKRLVRYLTFTV